MSYIAIDTETSGLLDNCNLLSACFIILDENFNEIDFLNISLKQLNGYFIYPEALVINKINIVNHHNNSTDLHTSKINLLHFLKKNQTKSKYTLIGHNVNFDIKFIIQSGLLSSDEYHSFMQHHIIDTLIISNFFKTIGKINCESLSLINLCKYFNLKENNILQHTSEYDIRMTLKLFNCLIKL
jgi:DNA polymerase III epsilon subunit-like protein